MVKPVLDSEELVRAFADLFNQVEAATEEEVDEILCITGHNPDRVAARMKAVAEQSFAEALRRSRQETLERLQEERERITSFESSPTRDRTSIIRAIKDLSSQLGRRVALAHRNLEEETDESLAGLLHHLEYLASQRESESKD